MSYIKKIISFNIIILSFLFLLTGYVGADPDLAFKNAIRTEFTENVLGEGKMTVKAIVNKRDFKHNDSIHIIVEATINSLAASQVIDNLDGLYLLVRAERAFDKQGRYHQFSNNYASTVLTPTGLPIENHDIFSTNYYKRPAEYVDELRPENRTHGRSNATPFDRVVFVKKEDFEFIPLGKKMQFALNDMISPDFPDGYYRFQVSIMAKHENKFYRVNFLPLFAENGPTFPDWDLAVLARNCSYLPIIKIGDPEPPKMIWTLFTNKFSNGMQGIIANEDKANFGFSSRHIVPADFILPAPSRHQPPATLKIEPDFPTMKAKKVVKLEQAEKWEFQTPIPLEYSGGQLHVTITAPDGSKVNVGPYPFIAESSTGATTGKPEFEYTFDKSGKYIIQMTGWIDDIWGNRYNGGGTYELFVANRLTFVTSVKPGTPFTVGEGYPPSAIIHPPCPADISIDVKLLRNSDPDDIKHVLTKGTANRFGYFYPRQKYKKMIFDAPGEYLSTITATYTDHRGNFWMGSQRGSSVVVPEKTEMTVHGAAAVMHNMSATSKRGNLNYEGKIAKSNNPEFKNYTVCTLFPFPYHSGDILYVANSPRGDNGIVPTLKASFKQEIFPGEKDDIALFSTTTNNYQPQGFPEFLDKQCYGYTSAIRSGFIARYMVIQDTDFIWDAYWQSGANFAGEQINNSYNGDLPQDIYGFLGGVVLKDFKTGKNKYGLYASMGVIIPQGSYANRVSAPFTEPLVNINGRDHYITDVGAPLPGIVFETTDMLRAGAMIFPPVEGVSCRRIVTCPSGEKYDFKGTTNKIGLAKLVAAQGADIPITEPGVYEVQTSCEFKNRSGDLIGSGDGKYYIYAVKKDDYVQAFDLDLPARFKLDYKKPLLIKGVIDPEVIDPEIHYTIIMPGMLMDEGILPVDNKTFSYKYSAADVAVQFPQYDIVKYDEPSKQRMADTVIFTFFLSGKGQNGKPIHSVKRFILRGDQGVVLQ
jgi:hypothetical protein